jgi:phosphatidate cytidylyltransferase
VFVLLLSTICFVEWLALFGWKRWLFPAVLYTVLTTVIAGAQWMRVVVYKTSPLAGDASAGFILLWLLLAMGIIRLLSARTPPLLAAILLALVMVGVMGGWMPLLVEVQGSQWRNLALLLIGTVVMFDTFCYVGGKLWGRTKILPVTSPGKTWEGLAIGSLCSAVFFLGISAVWERSPFYGLPLAVLVAVWAAIVMLAFYGDYAESRLKRQFGRKDSGFLLPGHGGFLDRFDSLLFVPFVILIVREIQLLWHPWS